ncbi:putative membrane protein YdjX (TVP38/TMEM64 family) [Natronobacillus azotifigens]|uniref:TVP38/TMEM64 family membrane protein n=1 Tax=Natronobacillus azotifigens TaxID=472978 RepID=A0A9J6RDA4_9BACI|nr:TVP38/TMEM64 family protein [Natronobacillus azotifigens]MCZ0703292.1 TVP38/TMEM64 family protein [Natronobacillus azotifigens]
MSIAKENNLTVEQIRELIDTSQYDVLIERILDMYEGFGPLPGILLPFIETFLPFLPLTVIVMTNAAAYGLLRGFLYSWIGESVGSIVVFMIIRRLRNLALFRWIHRNKHVKRVTNWLERHGFGPLFILLCFPFSPSSVINLVAALSKISLYQFGLAILLGKTVMIFSLAYVGSSIVSFAEHPMRTVFVVIGMSVFWLIGKHIEKRLHEKGEIDLPDEKVR